MARALHPWTVVSPVTQVCAKERPQDKGWEGAASSFNRTNIVNIVIGHPLVVVTLRYGLKPYNLCWALFVLVSSGGRDARITATAVMQLVCAP